MNTSLTQQRIRITFGKQGYLRFVGHLDLAKAWERVLRRARIPLEYSQGFNPRPRFQIAAPLPVGVTSEGEYLDAWLTARLEGVFPDDWIARLNATMPDGLVAHHIADVPIREASLPSQVTSADYSITPLDDVIAPGELRRRAEALLAAPTIERERRGKRYDLRPLILALSMGDEGHLIAQLKTGEHGNGRPDELLDALGLDMTQARIHRLHLYLDSAP
ncbi:MAG: DUF2344 domain-containing protein [Anaerolineae bacterium]|nr:DUF2344 domain-containing protein [Anaerolineae bacterium]